MQTPVKGNHSFANNFTVNLHDFLQFLGNFLINFRHFACNFGQFARIFRRIVPFLHNFLANFNRFSSIRYNSSIFHRFIDFSSIHRFFIDSYRYSSIFPTLVWIAWQVAKDILNNNHSQMAPPSYKSPFALYTFILHDFVSISVRQHGLMQGNIVFKVFSPK